MSVLVKGIRMPKNCSLCFLRDSIHNYCPYEANKETDCPLVEVVELTDKCIERIADAVVRKMNETKEERTCGNCKHSIGKHDPIEYVACNKEGAEMDGKYLDRHLRACERWEKE